MSKLGIYFNEVNKAEAEIKKTISHIEFSSMKIDRSISNMVNVKCAYGEVTNIKENLIKIKAGNKNDIKKLNSFKRKLTAYIKYVKAADLVVAKSN